MNVRPISVAAKASGIWMGIVLFVSFMTFAFNFLGTILCALVTGMMLGATSRGRWGAAAISLIFPGVVYLMLRLVKTEMLTAQIDALSGLCFAAFWLTYALTAGMLALERRRPKLPGNEKPSGPTRKGTELSRDQKAAACEPEFLELTLEGLQGAWVPESDQKRKTLTRTLEIRDSSIALRAFSSDGTLRWAAAGQLSLKSAADRTAQPVTTPLSAQTGVRAGTA